MHQIAIIDAARHPAHDDEHGADAEYVSKRTGQNGRRDIAGVVERFVAPDLMRVATLTDQPERDAPQSPARWRRPQCRLPIAPRRSE